VVRFVAHTATKFPEKELRGLSPNFHIHVSITPFLGIFVSNFSIVSLLCIELRYLVGRGDWLKFSRHPKYAF
jgi:hypothetical protein